MGNEVKLDSIDDVITNQKINYEATKKELQKTMSDKEIQDLENLVENAFKEVEKMPITNEQIYQIALENKKDMISIKSEIIDFKDIQKQTNSSLNGFFRKTWKLLFLLFILSSVTGYSLAVFQHDNIKPFFNDIAKELIKKVVHTD